MRRREALLVLSAAILSISSCARPADYADEHLRIVSLAPAITHVLIEIGLSDAMVAVGDYDDLAPTDIPSLGRFNDLDLERLTTLAPTHVLAMTGQASLPPRVTEMGAAGRFALADFDYPNRIAASLTLTREIGAAVDRSDRTEKIASAIEHQLESIASLTETLTPPNALMVFSTSPVSVSGPGTVNDELLRIAGGINAAAEAKLTFVTYDREALRALAPEVIFLMQPGAEPLRDTQDSRLDIFRSLDLPAMREGRVYLLNDPAVLLPGPSVALTAVSMAIALHPELAQPIAEVFRDGP